ncbi:MAG: hypothetical protein PHI35_00365, partial [Victivallaceae bacterium]|nr:hypothetical protein [Victivallaceae bacterium]
KMRYRGTRLSRMTLRYPQGFSRQELDDAAAYVAENKQMLDEARAWHTPVPEFTLPRLPSAPQIDGVASDAAWQKAMVWRGSYPVSGQTHQNDGAVWKLGWHGRKIYGAVFFPDRSPIFFDGRAGQPRSVKRIYEGDCLEVFIRAEADSRYYAEFILRPGEKPWCLDHVMNDDGWWTTVHFHLQADIQSVGRVTDTGYEIEFAIDPCAFRPDWSRRGLQLEDQFKMTMVRIDFDGNKTGQNSFHPLLHFGHNIFGYAKMKLGK